MLDMRLRLAELMAAPGSPAPTATQLAKRVVEVQKRLPREKRISERTVFRLVKAKGRMEYFHAPMLDVLCQVFRVEDANDLIELPPLKPAA